MALPLVPPAEPHVSVVVAWLAARWMEYSADSCPNLSYEASVDPTCVAQGAATRNSAITIATESPLTPRSASCSYS